MLIRRSAGSPRVRRRCCPVPTFMSPSPCRRSCGTRCAATRKIATRLIKAAAEAIIELARDSRFVGATVGVLAVLHTWTQQLVYHPHVHCLVTGGGVSDDGRQWHPARNGFLVPFAALAKLVCGKLRAALSKRRPDLIFPEAAWSKRWVVHCTAWGEGDEAVLRYLARYVFRVAITNSRIVGLDESGVTLRHKHRASNRWRTIRLSGHEFMRRFLQHVLPKGLHKIRYYGLWHPTRRAHARQARLLLLLSRPASSDLHAPSSDAVADAIDPSGHHTPCDEPRICPHCKEGHLIHIGRLYPKQASGP